MLDEKTVLHIFDSYWFEYGVFTANSPSSTNEARPTLKVQQEGGGGGGGERIKLKKSIKTLMRKSLSDQILSSKDHCSDDFGYPSPKSFLMSHKLQTILSSKEVNEFQESTSRKQEYLSIDDIGNGLEDSSDGSSVCISRAVQQSQYSDEKKRNELGRSSTEGKKKKKKKNSSKSLSELEFEELKGFMDLGFVFSDEDKYSRLVSIIPGLQRLGKEYDFRGFVDHVSVSRPYLSEAWDVMEDENRVNTIPLMDWRIPAFANEIELKNHLRFWAHTVASTVR